MKLKYPAILCLVFFMSCGYDSPQINQELSEKLVGRWQSSKLRLDLKSYKNDTTSKVFEADESNWEQKLNLRPIRTFFNADGTYASIHMNLKDSLIFNPEGKWMILGDTLHMMDSLPQRGPVYKYKLVIKGTELEMFGTEDCDNDGKADDLYYSKLRRL